MTFKPKLGINDAIKVRIQTRYIHYVSQHDTFCYSKFKTIRFHYKINNKQQIEILSNSTILIQQKASSLY